MLSFFQVSAVNEISNEPADGKWLLSSRNIYMVLTVRYIGTNVVYIVKCMLFFVNSTIFFTRKLFSNIIPTVS